MNRILPILVSAGLLAFVMTLQLPIDIYVNNADEFMIPLKSLIYTWGFSFVVVFSLCAAPAMIPYAGFRERYHAFISMLALLLWFTAHFMFGSYGAFDGRGLTIDPFTGKACIEVVFWVLLLISATIFSKKIHRYLYQATTGLLITVIALTGYQIFNGVLSKNNNVIANDASKEYMPNDFLTFSSRENIIHIVLDEQQSTVTEHLIHTDPQFRDNMTGFIFYPNTAANYRSTAMAIPAMLTGIVYKNESDKNHFLKEVLSHNPLTTSLEKSGFNTHIYTMGFYCNKAQIKNCIPQPELSPTKSAYLLLDYSLFKAVPDILKPAVYSHDRWVISRRFVNPSYEASLGGLNHLAFQYFNEHLNVADSAPTYKFYHSMITHSPAVLMKNCDLRTRRVDRHGMTGKADQAACAFGHIFTFLDKLKLAGIYDNTMIIISSDHGANYLSDAQQKSLSQSTVDERHYSTSLATLFIKPFKATGQLKISDAPVSLNDIPNTILAALNIPLLPQGENALALTQTQNRNREFIFYDYNDSYWGDSKLPPLTIYKIHGDVRDIRNWTLQCSDLGAVPCGK